MAGLSALFVFVFILSCGAISQEKKPQLSIEVKVEKEIISQKGNKKLTKRVSAEKAKKGDTLVYTLTYTNKTKETVTDVAVTDPIPQGSQYIIGTASGTDTEITFSIDGGKTFQASPVRHKVKKPDGGEEMRDATPDMFTHVKWLIKKKVTPGRSGQVYFKVIVK